jgi:phosphoribosylformylglycinamidine synthase
MRWRGKIIVDLSRSFLNTNGVKQQVHVMVSSPDLESSPLNGVHEALSGLEGKLREAFLENLSRLNVCSQKGLVEYFDSTIGAGTVLMPFGGKYQLTPSEGRAAKLPVEEGNTTTGTLMTYGFNPEISKWSPFHGAVYAIVESLSRLVAMGGSYQTARLTLQEYFEKLGRDAEKWGKPLSALLGAFYTQEALRVRPSAARTACRELSRTSMCRPPRILCPHPVDVRRVVSSEFKKAGSRLVLVSIKRDDLLLPHFRSLDKAYTAITKAIGSGDVLSCSALKFGGLAEAVSKMALATGSAHPLKIWPIGAIGLNYGAILLEMRDGADIAELFDGIDYAVIGQTVADPVIKVNGESIQLDELLKVWTGRWKRVFPTKTKNDRQEVAAVSYDKGQRVKKAGPVARPRVFIPVFPGTNCEYDVKRKFCEAGAEVDVFVLKNLTSDDIAYSVQEMKKRIDNSQIIMIPGGFSAGDEPEGSGKFIATVFRNPHLAESVMSLLNKRDGLMLGICNGFQALVKWVSCLTGRSVSWMRVVPHDLQHHRPPCFMPVDHQGLLQPFTWLSKAKVGDLRIIAISHGEGRFVASPAMLEELARNGQIATQYVTPEGIPTMDIAYNPNGSMMAIEGITSRDGRVFGKMGHDERFTEHTFINVPGEKDQKIFEAGVEYFL